MATRNFIQQGQAYGSTTAQIVVFLDGAQIYAGDAPTVNSPLPPQPGTAISTNLFTWDLPADFQGTKNIMIQVANSPLVLADTFANRTLAINTAAYQSWNFVQTIDGNQVDDPFTSVSINGQARTRDGALTGQWYWTVPAGQTFQATLNINAGINYPDWSASTTYPANSFVVYNTVIYTNGDYSTPAGAIPAEPSEFWFTLPVAQWDVNSTYAAFSRVQTGDPLKAYMALQNVPAGTAITNATYWQPRD